MSVEGLVVLFVILEFCVARPKEFQRAIQAVAGPLTRGQDEGCVSKGIFLTFVGGDAQATKERGSATQRKKRIYDCTLGHPGEDVVSES